MNINEHPKIELGIKPKYESVQKEAHFNIADCKNENFGWSLKYEIFFSLKTVYLMQQYPSTATQACLFVLSVGFGIGGGECGGNRSKAL